VLLGQSTDTTQIRDNCYTRDTHSTRGTHDEGGAELTVPAVGGLLTGTGGRDLLALRGGVAGGGDVCDGVGSCLTARGRGAERGCPSSLWPVTS
jgi:hypothetical protein